MMQTNKVIAMIWAQNTRGIIGARENGKDIIPWHNSADMQYFKQSTSGYPVIMGRTTWQSIPEKFRPLPGRKNIVLSTQDLDLGPNVTVCNSVDDVIEVINDNVIHSKVFVMGGKSVYEQFLPYADELYVSHIDAIVDHADVIELREDMKNVRQSQEFRFVDRERLDENAVAEFYQRVAITSYE